MPSQGNQQTTSVSATPQNVNSPQNVTFQDDSLSNPGAFCCPVDSCPKKTFRYRSATTLISHVNSHCKYIEDPDHYVPSSFFTTFQRQFCVTCRTIVSDNPRTHNNHNLTDSMPFTAHAVPVASSSANISNEDLELPSFEDILNNTLPSVRHIPRACRVKFAKCLSLACDMVTKHPEKETGFKLLFMLPTCCLRSPPRTGKSKRVSIVRWVEKLLQRWLNSDYMGLWEEAQTQRDRRQTKVPLLTNKARNLTRALLMAKEGNIGKALQCLQSLGIAPNCDKTIDQLLDKHPKGNTIPNEQLEPQQNTLVATNEDILREIKSFAVGSAPGRSCLRFEHLLDAFQCSVPLIAQHCLESVTSIVNLLLSGSACANVAKYICGAKLIALNKGDSEIRPIAVGELFRRIAAKVACTAVKNEAQRLLTPRQVGVAVSAACESVVHSVRDLISSHSHRTDMAVLKVDFSNAFNLIDRHTFIKEVRTKMPHIFNWIWYCYGSESILDYDNFTINSSCGVQQGDPLGPLLFSLALAKLTTRIDQASQLLFHVWYCDDGTLIGTIPELQKALNVIIAEGQELGLSIKLRKCELFWPREVDTDCFPEEIKRLPPTNGMDLLGSHIGNPESQENFLEKKIGAVAVLLEAVTELDDKQIELSILKNCLGVSKINHLLRSCPPEQMSQSLVYFDNCQRGCLETIIGKPLSNKQWDLALLPTRKGGLGLRSSSATHLPAFLASRVLTWNNVSSLLGPHLNIRESCSLRKAADAFALKVPCFDLEEHWGTKLGLQKKFCEFLLPQKVTEFFQQADPLTKANTLSFRLPHATDYLFAPPAKNLGLKFTNEEFRITLSRQLRLPIFGKSSICKSCNSSLMDAHGDHALICSSSGDRISRHNNIRDIIFFACKSAGLSPMLEANNLLNNSLHRPGDVYIPNWTLGSPSAVDVTLTCPLQTNFNIRAAEEVGYTCRLAEDRKLAASYEVCARNGIGFIPVALETSGGVGPSGLSFLNTLSDRCADNNFRDRQSEKKHLYQRMNVAVHRANANMILARMPNEDCQLSFENIASAELPSTSTPSVLCHSTDRTRKRTLSDSLLPNRKEPRFDGI